jgi:hypothetical protein
MNALDYNSLQFQVQERQARIFAEIADDRRADSARRDRQDDVDGWLKRSRLTFLLAGLANATIVIRS